jgi:hypothetical protein
MFVKPILVIGNERRCGHRNVGRIEINKIPVVRHSTHGLLKIQTFESRILYQSVNMKQVVPVDNCRIFIISIGDIEAVRSVSMKTAKTGLVQENKVSRILHGIMVFFLVVTFSNPIIIGFTTGDIHFRFRLSIYHPSGGQQQLIKNP